MVLSLQESWLSEDQIHNIDCNIDDAFVNFNFHNVSSKHIKCLGINNGIDGNKVGFDHSVFNYMDFYRIVSLFKQSAYKRDFDAHPSTHDVFDAHSEEHDLPSLGRHSQPGSQAFSGALIRAGASNWKGGAAAALAKTNSSAERFKRHKAGFHGGTGFNTALHTVDCAATRWTIVGSVTETL